MRKLLKKLKEESEKARLMLNLKKAQIMTTKTKLRGLSPRANYTDRVAAAGRRS